MTDFVKFLCTPELIERVDRSLESWTSYGYDIIWIVERDPRLELERKVPADEVHEEHKDAWSAVSAALYDLYQALNSALSRNALRAWRFECPLGPRDELDLANLDDFFRSRKLDDRRGTALHRSFREQTYTCVDASSCVDGSYDSYELVKEYAAPFGIGPTAGAAPGSETVSFILIYPPIVQPDFPHAMAGKSLAVAFRRFVLDDPLMTTALARASEASAFHDCGCVQDGVFSTHSPFWPVHLEPADLIKAWNNGTALASSPEAAPAREKGARSSIKVVSQVAAGLQSRFERFMGPIRSETIIARGRLVGQPSVTDIPAAEWMDRRVLIDFVNSELRRVEAAEGEPTREWTGVILAARGDPNPVDADENEAGGKPPKKKTRPEEYPWAAAFEDLVPLAIREQPNSKAALVQLMLRCLKGNGGRTWVPPRAESKTYTDPTKRPQLGDLPAKRQVQDWFARNHPVLWQSMDDDAR